MATDFIPEKEADFYIWQNTLIAYALTRYTNWRVPKEKWDALILLKSDYTQKYETALNPLTHTPGAILARQEAHKQYVAALRQFIREFLTYNSDITDEDRRNMGLPVHDTHPTPLPPPRRWPKPSVWSAGERHITVAANDPETDQKKKPDDAYGVRYAYGVFDTPPVDQNDLPHAVFSRKVEHTFTFTEAERGKRAYFACCYENAKGEPGPWSNIIDAITP